jgi:dihydropteroate synthase
MGALNVSPESFHAGSVHTSGEALLAAALAMVEAGAALIDVGARSTAPYLDTAVSDADEAARLARAVEALASRVPVPISADTARPGAARAALDAGARVINDISGLRDPDVAQLIRERGVGVILMASPDGVGTGSGRPGAPRTGPVAGGRAPAGGSVTRSPDSQLFELRTGRGGPTAPSAGARTPGATRPERARPPRPGVGARPISEIRAGGEGGVDRGEGGGPVGVVRGLLVEALGRAREAGIPEERIVLDPGIGFFREEGISWEEWDARVLAGLGELDALERPLCVGVSRKSFLGAITGRSRTEERLAGSLAATALAVWNGAALIRAHDVAEALDAARVAERIRGAGPAL